jgi:pimeloyl-ACP methyl ester carboxylesterase
MVFLIRPTLGALKRRHMSTTLHTNKVEGASSTVFLHGLLGNGKNLKTLATKFGGGSLLDLRGHGKSPSGSHPHTFENCAKDVLISVGPYPPATIVGHSFGGRVALECAVLNADIETANTTWLLDTVPGEINESVEQVITAIQSVNPQSYENRQQLAKALHQDHKLELGLAQWLTSSMTTSPDGLAWGFDVNVVNALLPEFGSQDFMGKLEYVVFATNHNNTVHLVRGAKNNGWTTEHVSTLQNLASRSEGRFLLHTLPNAGHWVHTDDLPGLVYLWEMYGRSS